MPPPSRLRDESGATMMEYGLVVTAIALAVVVAALLFGDVVRAELFGPAARCATDLPGGC